MMVTSHKYDLIEKPISGAHIVVAEYMDFSVAKILQKTLYEEEYYDPDSESVLYIQEHYRGG